LEESSTPITDFESVGVRGFAETPTRLALGEGVGERAVPK
jgi:hypothetical protein